MFLGKKYIDETTRHYVIIFLSVILNVGAILLLLLPKPDKGGMVEDQGKEGKLPITEQDEFALTQTNEGAWKTLKKAAKITFTKKFLILCAMFCNIGKLRSRGGCILSCWKGDWFHFVTPL